MKDYQILRHGIDGDLQLNFAAFLDYDQKTLELYIQRKMDKKFGVIIVSQKEVVKVKPRNLVSYFLYGFLIVTVLQLIGITH